MKRLICYVLLASVILAGVAINTDSRVYDKRNRIFEVTVNTHTAVLGGGYLPGRVYYHVENQSTSYDIKRATWPLSATDAGKILRAPDGWWEDKYNVYQSSWYYIIVGGGPGNVAAYTATICYQERD